MPTRSDALEQPADSHQDTPEVVRSGEAEVVEVVEEVKEVEVTPFTETLEEEDDSDLLVDDEGCGEVNV